MKQRHDLFFGSVKIGKVTQEDSDFPNLWGQIEFEKSISAPETEEARRMVRFIALDREYIRLLDLQVQDGESSEMRAINVELEAYTDYTDSEDWHLVDENGQRLLILAPVFHYHNEIVWRWNPGVP